MERPSLVALDRKKIKQLKFLNVDMLLPWYKVPFSLSFVKNNLVIHKRISPHRITSFNYAEALEQSPMD
jgi:hypothetical protein